MNVLSRFRRGMRLLVITHMLATHGMAPLAVRLKLYRPYAWLMRIVHGNEVSKETGVQIRLVMERLGPTFIKFGQMLSTRVDLLPMDVALELKKLQDAVPPEPFDTMKQVLERAYKKPLLGKDGVFSSFDSEPVAAASIAQVHFAELHDGRQVAVKVRRPQIKRTIEADLGLLSLLASMFDRYFPEYKRLKAPRVVEEFASTIREELNLRAEAAHASRFAENLAEVEGVDVPRVLWDYTTTEVLVTERIEGIPIDERERLIAAGYDTHKLCEAAITLFFHMAFVDGYFHADMHPGNIFVARDGGILMVDFGIVGRLDMKSRKYLAALLLAFLKQDYAAAALVHRHAGYIGEHVNLSAFEDALREVAEPIFNRPMLDISLAELLFVLFSVTERFQMETRPELLMLQKTMVVIEGVGRELEPTVNVWTLARPLVADWVARNMGPTARIEQGVDEVREGLESWLRLPGQIQQALAERQEQVVLQQASPSAGQRLLGIGILASGSAAVAHLWTAPAEPLFLPASMLVALIGAWMLWRR